MFIGTKYSNKIFVFAKGLKPFNEITFYKLPYCAIIGILYASQCSFT